MSKKKSPLAQKEIRYAFIDAQNLNLGVRSQGWELDFKKFYIFLKEKYKVAKAFLFIGYIKENEKLYNALQKYGFFLVFKEILKLKNGKIKGNVDAELVLHSAKIEYPNYDKAVIISGDGDFTCLVEDFIKDDKLALLMIPNQKSYSSLLKKRIFFPYIRFINNFKPKIEKGPMKTKHH